MNKMTYLYLVIVHDDEPFSHASRSLMVVVAAAAAAAADVTLHYL